MAATDAVTATAVARREARASMDRMQYHLGRGRRGLRGVEREIAFLDQLHTATIRQTGAAVGAVTTGRAQEKLGTKAVNALSTGRASDIGRMKSSILADFSADGLQPVRNMTKEMQLWKWTANASACPSCLDRHGQPFSGNMIPMHPSCLCIPQPMDTPGLRTLNDAELVNIYETYGDPRYRSKVEAFRNGTISRQELSTVEAVNKSIQGLQAVGNHLAKGEVVDKTRLVAGIADDFSPVGRPSAAAVEETVEEVAGEFPRVTIDSSFDEVFAVLEDINRGWTPEEFARREAIPNTGDAHLEYLYEKRGFNGLPQKLDDDAFDAIESETLFRGVPKQEFRDNFTDAPVHRGGDGIYGNGTYTANAEGHHFTTTSSRTDGYEIAKWYAQNGSADGVGAPLIQIKAPKANLVDYDDLQAWRAREWDSNWDRVVASEVKGVKNMGDHGRLAAAMGYDGIWVRPKFSGSDKLAANYTVILNRTKTVVRETF